jgi:ABC-type dipeptide/oligopeptide/nickel transport system permease subunit
MTAQALTRSPYARLARLDPVTLLAWAIFVITMIIAVAGPWLATHDPQMFSAAMNEPPGNGHLLGTDDGGRDVFSRLMVGTGLSLFYGASAALVALALGAATALIAMPLGKPVEHGLFAVVDLVRALPGILFALAFIVAFEPGPFSVVLALGVSFAPNFAIITRATYQQQMAQSYTQAAKVLGAGPGRIAIMHVLPNIGGALITQFAIILPRCIVSESVLSFLGLGASSEQPSWGRMIATATPFMEEAPHALLAPILALSAVTFALAIIGNAQRQRLTPAQKRTRT